MPKSHRSGKSAPVSTSEPHPRSPREIAAAWFSFHRVCPQRACRRAKRCAGGVMPPCFTALWPHVEEREKMRFRATVKARAEGADVMSAMAAGEADAARYDAEMAKAPTSERARPHEVSQNGISQTPPAPPLVITRVAPPPLARVRQL